MGSSPIPATKSQNADICPHFVNIRPVGQAVKTRPFHGCNMGSIPVRVTNNKKRNNDVVPLFVIATHLPNLNPLESFAMRLICAKCYSASATQNLDVRDIICVCFCTWCISNIFYCFV